MKRKALLKILLALMFIGIVSAGLVYKFVYNKPHPDIEKARPAHIISAAELFNAFRNDRAHAEARFNGKVILLTGKIDTVEQSASQVIAVFVFDQGMFGDEGIRCTMLPNHEGSLQLYAPGSEVQIKGLLTGYNDTDVILEKCSIVR